MQQMVRIWDELKNDKDIYNELSDAKHFDMRWIKEWQGHV